MNGQDWGGLHVDLRQPCPHVRAAVGPEVAADDTPQAVQPADALEVPQQPAPPLHHLSADGAEKPTATAVHAAPAQTPIKNGLL